MVGDGDGVHAEAFGLLNEVIDAADAVEKAVFGMDVEMSEHGWWAGDKHSIKAAFGQYRNGVNLPDEGVESLDGYKGL